VDPDKLKKLQEKQLNKRIEAFNRKKVDNIARRKNIAQKQHMNVNTAIMRVKEEARQDTWCTTHANCFRCSIGKAESEKHIRKKFDRFLEWRLFGATVFTELRLKDGSRPDLIICLNNGEVFIEEIVESEKEESLLLKEDKYPFPIKIIKSNCEVKEKMENEMSEEVEQAMERGQGQGVGGPRQGDGGAGQCKCPKCGETIPHNRGTPCTQIKCPSCNTPMIGQ